MRNRDWLVFYGRSGMALTNLAICNQSIAVLSDKALSVLDDTTELGRKYNTIFSTSRDALIKQVKPLWSKTRAIPGHVVDSEKTITGITQASPAVVTIASHGFSNDEIISVYDVLGMVELNGRAFTVKNVTTNTLELQSENSTNHTAYTSGGKAGVISTGPLFEFTYRYALPSNYICLIKINDIDIIKFPHIIENGELLTDEVPVKMNYCKQITDSTIFDADFDQLLAAYLSSQLAYSITNSKSLQEKAIEIYEKKKLEYLGIKAQEQGQPPVIQGDDQWVLARN